MGSKGHINLSGKMQTKARLRRQSMHEKQAFQVNATLGPVHTTPFLLWCVFVARKLPVHITPFLYKKGGKSIRFVHLHYKSSQSNVKIGVPQGSVLGALLFNIFLNDLFYMELNSEICNFADDNTAYSCGTRISEIMTNLENDLSTLLNWFYANGMVANPDKFQLMFLGLNERYKLRLNIEGVKISSTEHFKLLGIEIDNKLRFNKHVETQCDKTNKKVSAFRRLKFYLAREEAMKLCNTVIISNFNYCPLVWMFCGKDANHKINRTHKRALRYSKTITTLPLIYFWRKWHCYNPY